MKILIVDDAAFMRAKLKAIVEAEAHKVVGEADTGESAISKYQTLKPDLVFMDITMPGMDGISAIAKIKEFDPSARIVVASGIGTTINITQAIRGGAFYFLAKPYNERDIQLVLNSVVEGIPPLEYKADFAKKDLQEDDEPKDAQSRLIDQLTKENQQEERWEAQQSVEAEKEPKELQVKVQEIETHETSNNNQRFYTASIK